MFAVDVCPLPTTGGATGVAVAALFLLVLGVVVARWVRASSGQMSVVVAPLVMLGALVFAPSVADSCTTTTAPTVTTIAPTVTTTVPEVSAPPTTLAPLSPYLVLEIDTTLLPDVAPDSLSSLVTGYVFELGLFGDVDVHIDWGDTTTSVATTDSVSETAGVVSHTYEMSDEYTITVSGSLTGFGQSPDSNPLVGAEYLVGVSSFGDLGLTSLDFAFWSANNLVSVPSVLPSTVVSLEDTFLAATSFNGDISSWDTANVTNMSWMFSGASAFNQSLTGWDTSNVTNMSYMFSGASAFNQNLTGWDTSNVTKMSYMFYDASAFNQSLTGWDTSNVTNMRLMFYDASAFNQNLTGWDTSNVTNMKMMFTGASLFNSDLVGWDTSNVTNMSDMFSRASAFNQSLSSWDTSSVTDMSYMFFGASSFAGDISGWVTSNVTNMDHMFYFAESFNSDLGGWDISNVTDMSDMLHESGLSKTNYDDTLIGWSTLVGPETLKPDVELGASGLKFSSTGAAARAVLTNCTNKWQITGDSLDPPLPPLSFDGDQLVTSDC